MMTRNTRSLGSASLRFLTSRLRIETGTLLAVGLCLLSACKTVATESQLSLPAAPTNVAIEPDKPIASDRKREPSWLSGLLQPVDEVESFGKRQLSMQYTIDTRGFSTIDLTGSTPLPYQWNLWGFIDIFSTDGGQTDSLTDSSRFFYEVDLKRKLWNDLGVVFEVNDATGDKNSLGRIGAFYLPTWEFLENQHAKLFVKLFPIETDGDGGQASLAFNKRFPTFVEDRFSIGGFIDVNFDSGPRDDATNVVSETQFRYELTDGFDLFAEFRINEFLADDTGLGLGVQGRF